MIRRNIYCEQDFLFMRLRTRGFSLIELVVIILVLGIIARYALPRYADLRTSANTAATASIAAALAAASAANYTAGSAGASHSLVTNCTSIGPLIPGGLPAGYTITSTTLTNATAGTCTVSQTGGVNATTFTGVGISP
jgi:MSHA pilin protein MshA